MSSGVSSQAACDLEGGRPGQRFGSSPLLPAAPRRSPGRCRALSMLPGSGPQTGSGPSGHPARRRPSGRLSSGPTPLVSLCGGFTAHPGARGGGEHAYWGEKAVPQPWQREAQHSGRPPLRRPHLQSLGSAQPTSDEPAVPVALAWFLPCLRPSPLA